MKDQLTLLNQGFEENSNQQVVITTKNNKGCIRVSPLEKQPDPPHLAQVKYEIKNRSSDINLLYLLKETDFHTGFTKHFKTMADREILDRKSACIYSQLKSCLSSEVAAMMEGVLRHCTDMEVDRNYVDTHGQSVVLLLFVIYLVLN